MNSIMGYDSALVEEAGEEQRRCLWSSLPVSVLSPSGIWPYSSGKGFRLF